MKGKRISRLWKKKDKSMSDPMKEQDLTDPQPTDQEQPSKETTSETTSPADEQPQAPVDIDIEEEEASAESPEVSQDPSEVNDLDQAMKAIADLQLALREAQQEAEEAKAHALRLQADFQNFRRRQEKELINSARFANEDLLKQLLPILDNFDRTLDAMEKTDNLSAIKDGIGIVEKSMRKQLTKAGLEIIAAKGKPFNSELHDAITTIPVEDDSQKGHVLEEVEKGYRLKERVLRYAKVVVGE
jgi:molecular chaperone GrpE